MIRALHESGAKLELANRDGKTALDIAEAPQTGRRGRGPMPAAMDDDMTPRPRVAPREEVAALLRELLGWPAKPPAPAAVEPAAESTDKPATPAAPAAAEVQQ